MEIPMSLFMWINPLIIGLGLLFLYIGYKQGFLLQLYQLLSMFVSLFLAWLLSAPFANLFTLYQVDLGDLSGSPVEAALNRQINTVIWFIIIFVVVSILIALFRPIVKAIGKLPVISTINGFFGLIFGFIRYWIWMLIVLLILSFPLISNGNDVVEQTWLRYIKEANAVVLQMMQEPFEENEALQQWFSNEELTEEQAFSLRKWLEKQGLSEEDITEFLEGVFNHES